MKLTLRSYFNQFNITESFFGLGPMGGQDYVTLERDGSSVQRFNLIF